jgi:hypothetical protein
MEWKEAGKWFLVIVAAGVVGELISMLIEKQVSTVAKAETREEMENIVNAAVQNLQSPRVVPSVTSPPVKQPSSITNSPPKGGSYVFAV